ncbi:MAG TPA: Uma2 family endonuclease [Thermoanaerobaculia bacterium]|nr:Uma2 family endonuclease [Thermoanaerobaculia bacterium]
MSTTETALVSLAEYLEMERLSETKHEYINGRVYAMSPGATSAHYRITMNLLRALLIQTDGRPCLVYTSDARVKVSPTGMYTYPDISALCGEPRFENFKGVDTLLNPSVLIEVLSPTTELHDRGAKFAHYGRLESVHDYVLVSQKQMRVEHFVRGDDEWRLSELRDPAAILRLVPIGCQIALDAIYEGIEFPPADNSRWPR